MAEENVYDLIVIGGGPAGYAGAIRAGQLGKRVLCVEMERAGGTCLNWGCIPSKALLKSAELYQTMNHSSDYGFTCSDITVDFPKVMKRSRNVADNMGKGIEFLFKKNKVDYIVGKAKIAAPGMVEITEGASTGKFFTSKNILVATGCKARSLPNITVDGKRVMTSREALAMQEMPKSITILGAGAIGVEFAYFLNAFGCKVTLVEMLPEVVPVEDAEVGQTLRRSFIKQGIDVHVGTKAENINVLEHSVQLNLVKGDQATTIETDSLLIAIGVAPNTDGLLSSKIKLNEDRGFIVVDDNYQTSQKGIYAAGDIIGAPWLAHVATFEAIQAVNGMFGAAKPKRVTLFPGCTYCQPQVASIGMTEAKAKEKGIDYKIGKFPFTASGKAVAINKSEGFVKVITDSKFGEILGAHIIGNDATELIAEYALAMNLEATIDDVHHTIHAHPTLSEALAEAAAAVRGEAIHI
ncbi:MAG: dihydrolipoyl dehydrogenase [Verrucomicrobia bacterium CG_4_10_14_3_um_filter_43_23]|nr:MAG: dihydrolipoyl dehydrogenase [Verrucomicrobia bacterium CG1_02_43_26]PIP59402.1 MAG: dihydrolipoyl dehydrogenase [Verrucomicrobia bacterium CG22_combo_CG10-13_8_21_14_all_43_17]PIX58474.1 MAG: dihydrolipoyl dehydrogenase [Verrucomicrobia bacterium CG_4_10_14_3_um_filter_43_23]PIY62224.1 MAG: dihydrolipoyl dehydrogenase [Verrucomicrobia bacterium CG_4_10_14_0_8_um_filter_43_34]PJA44312.1 MAG: dihydrolipoyl dehydrogenase [Verrucomicrobia bacterium CG_4_9_14_3_um_filter_43_20]